jgi:3-hydroxyacyl-[acyl-carrier-protein] dehydratase
MSRMEFAFDVAPDHPSLPGHFPGHPIVPGVLLLDHVFQALRRSTGKDVSHVLHAKFTSALLPGEQAQGACVIEQAKASFRVTAQRGGSEVTIAEGAVRLSQVQDVAAP